MIFTIGFLFNRRIFPHANDCNVRFNSGSTENILEKNKILLNISKSKRIRTNFSLFMNIFVSNIVLLIKKKKNKCLIKRNMKFFYCLKNEANEINKNNLWTKQRIDSRKGLFKVHESSKVTKRLFVFD